MIYYKQLRGKEVEQMKKNKKQIKIRNTKSNIFFIIIGRLATYFTIYVAIEIFLYKIIIYVLDNCITTI